MRDKSRPRICPHLGWRLGIGKDGGKRKFVKLLRNRGVLEYGLRESLDQDGEEKGVNTIHKKKMEAFCF